MEYAEINCIYSEKSSIAHDKACRYAKIIDEKNIVMAKKFPARKYTYCKVCGRIGILRSSVDDVENLDKYVSLFKDIPTETQNLMKKRLDKFDGNLRLPISSIGNLCLLPEYANRSKKDKTIYEDTDYLFKSNMTIEQVEERYSFTKKKDLDWILDTSLPQDEFEKAYMTFIKNHFGNMKKVLKDHFEQI